MAPYSVDEFSLHFVESYFIWFTVSFTKKRKEKCADKLVRIRKIKCHKNL
jgi:hypothetical protein